ncbi:hypothetical protein Csa_015822 [Cucumis sativus]|uniref:Uncharacterized protein n=1 Tax=Cucumis sativus TaxID=3659 RepID=A0A0A0KA26_CUCSA|nr:hypothetical protein Csa_015822 [Cucumis sativus]
MKDKGVAKEPGVSWIQMKCRVHYFLTKDDCHDKIEGDSFMLEGVVKTSHHGRLCQIQILCSIMWKKIKNKISFCTIVRSLPLLMGSCTHQTRCQLKS